MEVRVLSPAQSERSELGDGSKASERLAREGSKRSSLFLNRAGEVKKYETYTDSVRVESSPRHKANEVSEVTGARCAPLQ